MRGPGAGAALLCAALGAAVPLPGEEFFYQHRAGDKYRVISTVNEDVYLDRRLSHHAEILNRITVDVLAEKDGTGTHEAVFLTAEKSAPAGDGGPASGSAFEWAREYKSVFDRDKLGRLRIGREYFMPVVRDVPVFPGRGLQPGDTWAAEGHEMHDFRDSFGIAEPYRIPFTASYTFLGSRRYKDSEYPAFSVTYRVFDEPEAARGEVWPRRILGASDQIIYWDSGAGQPRAYTEEFRIVFELSDGRTVEYRGDAQAEVVRAEAMDRESLARDIRDEIERLGMEDIEVREGEGGITLSLENIQFGPSSAALMESEKEKLDRLGAILRKYPGRDILVAGHAALAGVRAERDALSLERANAVADYLIGSKVRPRERVITRGFGAERPLASNADEEGRRKNRRVEITILEN
ncbi:MAG: OmpA family protein [Treponematales bacterium]